MVLWAKPRLSSGSATRLRGAVLLMPYLSAAGAFLVTVALSFQEPSKQMVRNTWVTA